MGDSRYEEHNKVDDMDEMPIIVTRKLVTIGDGSAGVIIPSEWLKRNGLKVGDKLLIVADGDLKIILPRNQEQTIRELNRAIEGMKGGSKNGRTHKRSKGPQV